MRIEQRIGWFVRKSGSRKTTDEYGKDLSKKSTGCIGIVLGKRRCMLYGLVDFVHFSLEPQDGAINSCTLNRAGKDRQIMKEGKHIETGRPPK